MLYTSTYLRMLSAIGMTALPWDLTTGFLNPQASPSSGSQASCVTGLVPVAISAVNKKLLVDEPVNQTVVTEIIQELYQANSTIRARLNGGSADIRETYNIETTLCIPKDSKQAQDVGTVEVLIHGVGTDKSYWDIAPGYSYVDASAAAGRATVAYNRLGVGNSDHPDPIQVVQSFVDLEIQHGLVALIHSGKLGSGQFKKVVGVGHSYGSIVQLGQTAKYPGDVDAAVLTGFVDGLGDLPTSILTSNPAIANINGPTRFKGLPNGYLVHDTPISVQLPFFRFPFFDPQSVYAFLFLIRRLTNATKSSRTCTRRGRPIL